MVMVAYRCDPIEMRISTRLTLLKVDNLAQGVHVNKFSLFATPSYWGILNDLLGRYQNVDIKMLLRRLRMGGHSHRPNQQARQQRRLHRRRQQRIRHGHFIRYGHVWMDVQE